MSLLELREFRNKLDDVMCSCIRKRIVLYGYNRTSRFIKWYAKYYHAIDVDYIIDLDDSAGHSFEHGFYAPTVFMYGYKGVEQSVIWLTEQISDSTVEMLSGFGFKKNINMFDFFNLIYGDDCYSESDETDPFVKKKSGRRDIQLLEYLEWKYDCNFVEFISSSQYVDNNMNLKHGAPCKLSTQQEIFPILDQMRNVISDDDAIFDFGCGKGGAIVSFLDYGFTHVGGVEYESGVYQVLEDNIDKLDLRSRYSIETYCCDATKLDSELDRFNIFYFFNPFDEVVCEQVINNICKSMDRQPRKITILLVYPTSWKLLEETERFRLTAQMGVDLYQRVVDIYESI